MQVAFAVGAEVEARIDGCATLRTVVGQRLAHQQIDYEAEHQVTGHENEYQEGPQRGVHAPALGIFVDVTHHGSHDGEN